MQASDQKQKVTQSATFTRGPIMLTLQSDLHGNHLLGALPSHEWQALAPHLELVHLRTEQLLCDSGQRIHHVYFPTTAIISMLSTMEDGSSVEIAAVGREGMTGVPVLTGGETMPNRVQVQRGLRIPDERASAEAAVRALRLSAPPDAAVYARAAHAGRADRRVQSP